MDSQDTGSTQAGQDVGAQQPDPQTLYQQHLAHWQAAFQEYWKCMASQGAAMPQPWAAQAMMGGGYGGMPYFTGGMMNPYGGMMSTGPPAAAEGSLPAADMPLANDTHEAAAPVAATEAAPLPVITATTATSSQAGLPGNGADSDADSGFIASDDGGDLLLPVLDPPAVSSPGECADMQLELELQQQEAPSSDITLDPFEAAGLAAIEPGPPALTEDAPPAAAVVGSMPAAPVALLQAASRALASTATAAISMSLAPPAATLVLPVTGIAPSAAPAAGTSVGAVGLPVMGLAQPAALAAVSQAAAQLSSMADAGGLTHSALTRHHSTSLSLLGDDGLPLDEKDVKRLRRKQSNRESARRSRLRKQAENDTLQQRLHDCETQRNSLIAENAALKQRMEQLTLLVARLSQDKAALLTQVRNLGGQVGAELETAPITTIPTISADTLQQQIAAAAAVSQAVAASQAAIVPAAAVSTQAATLAAVAGLPEQLHPPSIQLQGIAVATPQPVAAVGGTAEVATAILASA